MDFPVETYTEHVESCPEVYISCVNCNHSYERKKKIFHTETDCTLNNLSKEYNNLQLEFNKFKIESQTLTNQMKSHIRTLERNLEKLLNPLPKPPMPKPCYSGKKNLFD